MSGLTYDTGALVAAERNDRAMWALHRRSLERELPLTVPAVVLAQGWRGGPQPSLSRLLRGCQVEDLTEPRARAAGTACGRAHVRDIVDAAVVVGALARTDLVVTSDPGDLARIATALGRKLNLHRI
jgi:hypothetical protein